MNYKFIHIPKTAGSYFFKAVYTENSNVEYVGHRFNYPVEVEEGEGRRNLGAYTIDDNCEYISIVRNPFDLLHSYYHYDGRDGSKGWANCRTVHGTETFSEFVELYINPQKWFHYPPFKKSLYSMIKTPIGEIVPQHVLKFETLSDDIEKFCETHNLMYKPVASDSKDRNTSKTPKTHYSTQYSQDQVLRLSSIWANDLKIFNYEF